MNIKKIVEDLIETFLKAGDLSISLRDKGLKKEIKSDNTPVSNGDLEVNKFITKKIFEMTPDIPIISEENSENKDSQIKKFKRFIRNWDGKNNLIFVTHYVVIYEILGYTPSSGEIIISNKDLKVIDTIEIEY